MEKRTWLEHRRRDRLHEIETNLPNLSSSSVSAMQTSPVVPPPSPHPSTLAVPPLPSESPSGPCSHVDSTVKDRCIIPNDNMSLDLLEAELAGWPDRLPPQRDFPYSGRHPAPTRGTTADAVASVGLRNYFSSKYDLYSHVIAYTLKAKHGLSYRATDDMIKSANVPRLLGKEVSFVRQFTQSRDGSGGQ